MRSLFLASMPGLFVLLWSTGFIGAKLGLPYAGPFTFLFWRFCIVAVLLGAVAVACRASWPRTGREAGHAAVSGLLVHGVYLGGVFAAIGLGLPAGLCALIVGLQPLLTALLAGAALGERVSARQWLGLALGLAGVALVLGEKALAGLAGAGEVGLVPVLIAVAALFGITLGTLYQKRFGGAQDLRTATVVQYAACALVYLPLAATEDFRTVWSPSFLFALGWLVVVLSVGAISLLMLLIRQGEASRVASFFYLVPPVTALEAFFLFDEGLGMTALVGMAVAAAGVAMAVKK